MSGPDRIAKLFRLFLSGFWLCYGLAVHAQLPAVSFNHLNRDIDLYSSRFKALTEDNRGFIWFGSSDGGGLYRFDGYSLRAFTFDPSRIKTSLTNSRINDICQVNDTLMYIGTSFGYSMLNPITGTFRSFNNVLEELEDNRMTYIFDFLQDSAHKKMWIATGYGLAGIDHSDGVFRMVPIQHSGPDQEQVFEIVKIIQDNQDPNRLYLTGWKGLYQFDINTGVLETLPNPWNENETWYPVEICQTPDGRLFIGANKLEVLQYKPDTRKWKSFPLPASERYPEQRQAVLKLSYLDSDKLLVSTFTQVGILNLTTGILQAWEHDPENPGGLLPHHYYVDHMTDRHGKLWVSSWQGVQYSKQAILSPSDKVRDLHVAITEIDITPRFEKDSNLLLYTTTLRLDKSQRDITVHYVLPNPMDAASVTYQYMLDGYDDDWVTTDQRVARYAKLKGGDYTFKIKAQEIKNGGWTPVTEMKISIPRKLTELLWFWLAVSLCALLLSVGLFYILISRAKKEERIKAEFEHQLSEIQMQALRAQMNPHFLFNSLNSIKYFAISKSKDETAAYLSKFAMLVRAILNNSKEKTISLNDELEALRLYIEIEHLRLEGKFNYEIQIDPSIRTRQTQIPPMILQPYVENAIWHGLMHKEGRGLLRVEVKDMGRQIQCVVEDNGIGRVKSAELRKGQVDHRKSVGMQITGDRIALINKMYKIDTRVDVIDLEAADGSPAGTRVVIHIPLIHDEEE
jgi:hypothetical protein